MQAATVMPHLSRPRFAHKSATFLLARFWRKTLIINLFGNEFGFSQNDCKNHDSSTDTEGADEKMAADPFWNFGSGQAWEAVPIVRGRWHFQQPTAIARSVARAPRIHARRDAGDR